MNCVGRASATTRWQTGRSQIWHRRHHSDSESHRTSPPVRHSSPLTTDWHLGPTSPVLPPKSAIPTRFPTRSRGSEDAIPGSLALDFPLTSKTLSTLSLPTATTSSRDTPQTAMGLATALPTFLSALPTIYLRVRRRGATSAARRPTDSARTSFVSEAILP